MPALVLASALLAPLPSMTLAEPVHASVLEPQFCPIDEDEAPSVWPVDITYPEVCELIAS